MAGNTTINGVQLEWFVQSGVRITAEAVLYVDPHLIRDGEKADLILITHDHFDHLDIASIEAVAKDDTVIVANACCVPRLQGRVAAKVVPIKEGETVREKGIDVRAVAGYNYIHPRGSNVGFMFTLGGQTIYHAGDTDHIPEMASLGSIDIALLPIGGTYTMDEREAAEALRVIQPKVVIPIHYGYGTGGDPEKFALLAGAAARVVILDEVRRAAA
ncbi:MAG: MBL fold metallo-hydrolase [Dehalococcoidia bacterium]|nr:MAG: MBL fold metallo-hydrolase [Dehalococcoidia bacterium]